MINISHLNNEDKKGERSFIQGLGYAVGWIIRAHDEPTIAIELLDSSGYTYADLVAAECDPHDLKPIAKELELHIDGTPRTFVEEAIKREYRALESN